MNYFRFAEDLAKLIENHDPSSVEDVNLVSECLINTMLIVQFGARGVDKDVARTEGAVISVEGRRVFMAMIQKLSGKMVGDGDDTIMGAACRASQRLNQFTDEQMAIGLIRTAAIYLVKDGHRILDATAAAETVVKTLKEWAPCQSAE